MNYNDLYNRRYDKIKDTVAFKNKSVTTIYNGSATPAAAEGITLAEYTSNPETTMKHFLHYINRLNSIAPIDGIQGAHPAYINIGLAMGGWSLIKMPGRELPENSVWQVEEKERITPSDYDYIIENGKEAMFKKLMPEIVNQNDFQLFLKYIEKAPQNIQTYIDSGYPIIIGAMCQHPFETLSGGRGMNNFFLDCYKIPDKIKAVQDSMIKSICAQIEQLPKEKYVLAVFIGCAQGASNMVNQKIWDKLVWPNMKEIVAIVVKRGFIPLLHWDACWDRDIECLKDLSAKTVILNTDGGTDLSRARKLLGDHVAFMGDVPGPLLALASKQEVTDYVKHLIDDVGPQGLFLCPGCDAPATAKFENMAAMYETAYKY
ncbi:MAG: methyltransferase [Treponema sp.]|jgi:uroporphyrinogen-III decarboxylase|nr:methyltransferase [Treponema sp.]